MLLLRLLVLAAMLGVCLVGGAPAGAQDDPSSAAPGPDPDLLQGIQDQVSQLRKLPSLADVQLSVLDHAGLRQYLVDTFERDYLPSERESDQKELVALGLIKPSDDIVKISLDLLSDEVIGVYDPDQKAMVVLGDVDTFGPAERVTFAHEFTHALQDQHYDLNRLAPKHPTSNDRSLAVHALIEGDAVMLQTQWARSYLSVAELGELVRGGGGGGDTLAAVPPILRAELLFPYIDGLNFVRQIYQEAGNDYTALDAVFRHPPESTAQILHLDKYRDQVHPTDVELPDLAARLGPDWRQVGSGVLGELDLRVLLEQYGDRSEAARVAPGWSGDRWLLLEQNGHTLITLKTTWDSEASARAFFAAYGRGLRARFPGATAEQAGSDHEALTAPTAATDLRLTGRDVLAVIGFDRQSVDGALAALSPAASALLPVPAL